MKKIYIIVLNWNGKDDTLNCLHSLHNLRIDKVEVKILVVDNASTDNSVAAIRNQYKSIEIVENEYNLGFAGGINVGIEYALKNEAEGVLLLNNDTRVDPNFLSELLKLFKLKEKIGIVGPILKFKKGFEVFYDLGGKVTFYGRAFHNISSLLLLKEPKKVDYVSGAAMFIKREVFEAIGKMDETYFFGWEAVDFCIRAKEVGFETYLVPSAMVEHKIGGTIRGESVEKIYYNLRNNLLFVKIRQTSKILGYPYGILLGLKICFNNSKYIKAVIRSWLDFIKGKFGKLEGYL